MLSLEVCRWHFPRFEASRATSGHRTGVTCPCLNLNYCASLASLTFGSASAKCQKIRTLDAPPDSSVIQQTVISTEYRLAFAPKHTIQFGRRLKSWHRHNQEGHSREMEDRQVLRTSTNRMRALPVARVSILSDRWIISIQPTDG